MSFVCFHVNSEKRKIEFRKINNLEHVLLCFSVDSPPMRLAVSQQSILVCESSSGNQRVVNWLDCCSSPPKPATDVAITHIHTNVNSEYWCPENQIFYMCCVNSESKQLLATITKSGALRVFDVQGDKLEWEISKCKLLSMKESFFANGLATDGSNLFVIDRNNRCVQMFRSDSEYLRCVLKAEDHSLGVLQRIRWLQKASSLVVWNNRNLQNYINIIKIDV